MTPPNIIRQDEINVVFVRSELDDAGLDPFEFRVYAHIARRVNCFAKMDNIGAICGMSGRQARRSLMSLAEKGMIEMVKRPGSTHLITLMPPRNWSEPVWVEIRKNRSTWKSSSPEQGTDCKSTGADWNDRGGRTVSPPKDIPSKGIPIRDSEESDDYASEPDPEDLLTKEQLLPIEAIPPSPTPNSARPPSAPLAAASAKPKAQRPRDLVGEAMLEVCWGITDYTKATSHQWSFVSRAIKELKAVQPDLNPRMIREFASKKRREWEGLPFSPGAITKHWQPISSSATGSGSGQSLEQVENEIRACRGWPQHMEHDKATDEEKAQYASLKAKRKELLQ